MSRIHAPVFRWRSLAALSSVCVIALLLGLVLACSARAQAGDLAAPTLLSPSNGATGVVVLPTTLSWHVVTYATSYTVQISTVSDFSTVYVTRDGITTTSVDISNLAAGTTYYWRVKAYATKSDTYTIQSPYSAVWSFTTKSTILTAPSLLTPANAATAIPLPPRVTWSGVAGAAAYVVQVAETPNFSTILLSKNVIGATSAELSGLLAASTYYWRVKAYASGQEGPWSSTWSFTTGQANALVAPTLLTPSNGATHVALSPKVTWSALANASAYSVQIATTADFVSTVGVQSALTNMAELKNLLADTTYYWRVRAVTLSSANVVTSEGPWSTGWSFTTMPTLVLGAPTLLVPANGATNVALPPRVSWSAVTSATGYAVQFSLTADFATVVAAKDGITGTTVEMPGLLSNTVYFWRVRAVAAASATNAASVGPWSTASSFTTAPPSTLLAPTLLAPANGATGQVLPLRLYWSPVAGATGYVLQLARVADFSVVVLTKEGLTATSIEVPGLLAGTTYYWRVRAYSQTSASTVPSQGPWSTVWSFATAAAPVLAAPTLLAPASGTTGVLPPVTVSWSAVANAAGYTVQVSTSAVFATTVQAITLSTTATTAKITGLVGSTTYYWRVRAYVTGASGPWSTAWSFTTAVIPTLTAPVLTVPANGATNVALPPHPAWHAVANAATYQIQVARVADFSALALNKEGLTATTVELPGLLAGTTYYWRVRASAPGVIGPWSDGWSFVTAQALVLGTPTLLAPANGAQGVALPPVVSWTAITGAQAYVLQVATTSDFATVVTRTATVTSIELPGLLNNTTYYWRVRAYGSGVYGAFSAYRSFTTAPDSTFGIPTLLSPTNGATNIALPPHLTWTAVTGATGYVVQIARVPDFSAVILTKEGLTSTAIDVPGLLLGTTYYWRVRAYAVATDTSPAIQGLWCTPWSFSTLPAPELLAPVLTAPTNGATAVALPPHFSWQAVTNATGYLVQVSTSSDFATVAASRTGTGTTVEITGLLGLTTYYWRVKAYVTGAYSPWSTVWSFTTAEAPVLVAPTLLAPANQSLGVALPPVVSWAAVTGVPVYVVEVSTTDGFTTLTLNKSVIGATSMQLVGLALRTKYYWRVKAYANGAFGPYSAVWSFTTGDAPVLAAPVLTAPANGATGVALPPHVYWNAVTGANGYVVQVAAVADFSTVVLTKEGLTTTTAELAGLQAGTKYYWRVRAYAYLTDSSTPLQSAWSTVWAFLTASPTPALTAPTLIAPTNTLTGVAVPPQASWSAVTGAQAYAVEVSTTSDFLTIALSKSSTGTTVELSGLQGNTTYYWRVKAYAGGVFGPYSAVWSFTTAQAPTLTAPTLVSPAHGATGVSVPPVVSWSAVANAAGYWVQVATTDGFTSILIGKSVSSGTAAELSGLAAGTTYFWRVRAAAVGVDGPWSLTRSFTTAQTQTLTAPTLTAPTNGATGVALPAHVTWSTVVGATGYTLQVGTVADLSTVLMTKDGLTTGAVDVPNLSSNTTYYWRVRAYTTTTTNTVTTTTPGPWSTIWSFTTAQVLQPPTVPTLVAPANNDGVAPPVATLSWNAAERATTYVMQLSRNEQFTDVIANETVTTTTKMISTLVAGTQYWWRVKAVNNGGASAWSTVWTFMAISQ